MRMREKNSFIVYHDIDEIIESLSGDQCKELFLRMISHSRNGQNGKHESLSDPVLNAHFINIRITMDRDKAKWAEVCKKRAEGGKKGGRPKNLKDKNNLDDTCNPDSESEIDGDVIK